MARPLQPEKVIDNWSGWGAGLRSRPVLVEMLSGGRSNHSFLLNSDIGKLVLRLNGPGSLLPGASRDCEYMIWQEASRHGIAPPLVFVDAQNQYLVSIYIDNELPSKPHTNPTCIAQAFRLLDRCHQLDINAPAINYFDHIEHYWRIIEAADQPPDPGLVKQSKPIELMLESLLNSDDPWVLCHHDPVVANFVGSPERLYLIDWEYAATGLQIMDYAALAVEWQIDDATVVQHAQCHPELLGHAREVYRYVCALWQQTTTRAQPG